MRCLTLAKKLREHGSEVSFICRELPGSLASLIYDENFELYNLPISQALFDMYVNYEQSNDYAQWLGVPMTQEISDVSSILDGQHCDLLIVDHYSLSLQWEKACRKHVKNIMVIDDLANRPHDCDYLLDQNYTPEIHKRYPGLVPSSCKLMFGPAYALLRDEFAEWHKKVERNVDHVERILVFFGGVDKYGLTKIALEAIKSLQLSVTVDVVVGMQNNQCDGVEAMCRSVDNFYYHRQVSNMAELMANAQLAICASGATTWERCCIGLPGIVVTVANNQTEIGLAMNEIGFDYLLGDAGSVTVAQFIQAIKKCDVSDFFDFLNPRCGYQLVDGGGAKRVMEQLND